MGSVWVRCQMDVDLIHLVFIFYHHLGCILWTLRVPKVAGKITQHLWEVVPIRTVAMGPSLFIFLGSNVVSHLRDKHFNDLKFAYLSFQAHQVVEHLRREVTKP